MPSSTIGPVFSRARRPKVPVQAQGFALPVALGASLLLLRSSSLQLLALQTRVQAGQSQRRHQIEDTLASAAQLQAAALHVGAGCLLSQPLQQWSTAASACGLGPQQVAAAQQGQVDGQPYRVRAYTLQNSAGAAPTAELELQLLADRPWRAGFRVQLDATTQHWRITAVKALGLRGVQA